MKLSSETIEILTNFTTINQSLVFNEGNVLATISYSRAIMAKAKIKEMLEANFGIYDLGKFLSVLSLFNEPDLIATDKVVTISSQGKKVNYTCADVGLIYGAGKINPYEKNIKMPSIEVSFELSKENLSDLKKAASVLKLPDVVISGDGENIYLQAMDVKNPTGDVYSLKIAKTSDTFKFIIRTDNLKLLPNDYTIQLSSKRISRFFNETVEYFIALEDGSSFGE